MGKLHILKGNTNAPAAAAAADGDGDASGGGGGGGKSVAEMLAAEVAELKDTKKAVFRWHDTGVNNTIFVHFPKEEGA